MQQKETRRMASVTRYRQQLSQVETQNKELQNDLHFLEQQRLAQWQAMRVCVCLVLHALSVCDWGGGTLHLQCCV